MRKKKHKLLKLLIITLILGSIGYLGYINYGDFNFMNDNEYDKDIFKNIDNDTEDKILGKKYSTVVDKALSGDEFNEKYLDLYYEVKDQDDDNLISNINMLADIGYSANEINLIYEKLTTSEIPKLKGSTYTKNIDEYIAFDYFMPEYLNRYITYKKKTDYSYEKTITYINIGLDYNFYDTAIVKEVTNPSDPLVLVNKYNNLPEDYSPALVTLSKGYSIKTLQVTDPTKNAFEKLCDAAAAKDLTITAVSTYRTYSYQKNLYNNYVLTDGQTNVDTYSARPGYSEHHTGLAIDVQGGEVVYDQFATTDEYQWVKANAHLYGFIIRYPEDKTNITGYKYEAWHLRYVGVEVATYIHEHDITFDEYYAQFLINK